MNQTHLSKRSLHHLMVAALLGGCSAILMLLEISLPFAPTFVKFDLSELPVLLGGLLLGPIYGSGIALIKILLNFILNGSYTAGIGELINLIGSLSFMLPAVLYIRYHHRKYSLLFGLVLGTCITTFILLTLNYFVMFPLYAKLMHLSLEKIIAMGTATNPLVHNLFGLMIFSLLPFNLFKYGVTACLTLGLYRRLSKYIRNSK